MPPPWTPCLSSRVSQAADRLLVEEFLSGREGTCGYLAGFPPLAPTEIRPVQDGFFSFEAKYQAGGSEEITPAGFPPEVIAEMQRLAARAHASLSLSVYSRTDFIYTGQGPGTDSSSWRPTTCPASRPPPCCPRPRPMRASATATS